MIPFKCPLITCVCVTKNRPDLLKRSIACYINQIYPNKKLVIVSQGDENNNHTTSRYLKSLNRGDILFLEAPPTLTLGAMRNVAVELATGEIVCQWDDDDVYHPLRLITQYKALIADSRNVASLYSEFLKYFSNSQDVYWCDWSKEHEYSHRFLCGSIMFYKSLFYFWENFYPECGSQSCSEEDLHVLEKLIGKGLIAPVTEGSQYIYVYHGLNTYDLDHHKLTLDIRWGKKILDKTELLKNKETITESLGYLNLDDKIYVKSLDELAFIYDKSFEGVIHEV